MRASGLTVVVDHVAGARRGERQALPADARVRFGRHPECEVAFDAHADLDASSRHAELRPGERAWMLVDLGSSNGTFVGGQRVTEARVDAGRPVEIEFGAGGPRVRLFVGDAAAVAGLPPAELAPRRVWPWVALAVGVAVLAACAALWAR